MLETPKLELDIHDASALNEFADVPEIGSFEALTDVIKMMFQSIDSRIERYLLSMDDEEKEELQKEMKRFLSRINANSLIPLQFRLKVLHTFGKEASFLDGGLTSSILDSYKVAILLLLEASEDKESYLLALARMCGQAIHLAMRVSRLHLAEYREPRIQVTKQVHAFARIGLGALNKVKDSPKTRMNTESIKYGLIWYELMRAADFFRLARGGQELVYDSIEPYISNVSVEYCPKNQAALAPEDHIFLISYVDDRPTKPEWTDHLKVLHVSDRILLDITKLLPVLKTQLSDVIEHMKNIEKQKSQLRTEIEIHNTHKVTLHLLSCMHILPRKQMRHERDEALTLLSNFKLALGKPNKPSFRVLPILSDDDDKNDLASQWTSMNVSRDGIGIETDESMYMPQVSSLVRIVWANSAIKWPFWGVLVWRRHSASRLGHTTAGIQFLHGNPAIANMQSAGKGAALWPVLFSRLHKAGQIMIWSSETHITQGMVVLLDVSGKVFECKIVKVLQRGSNYVSCQAHLVRRYTGGDIELDQ